MTGKTHGPTRRTVLKKGALLAGGMVIGGTAVSGTAAAGIGDGRVAHFHLNTLHLDRDSWTWSIVKDASPANNHGTNNGASVVEGGAVGNAFDFDGDSFVAIENDPSLVFGDGTEDDPFSISAWVKVPDAQNAFIVGKGLQTSGLEYVLNVDTAREWAQFRMYSGGGGQTIYRRVAYPSSSIGEWHHVAGTYDGSGSSDGISVYVDGVEGTTVDTRDSSYVAMADRGDDVELGAILRGDARFGGVLTGKLDEVRIYNGVLSDEDVAELADMGED